MSTWRRIADIKRLRSSVKKLRHWSSGFNYHKDNRCVNINDVSSVDASYAAITTFALCCSSMSCSSFEIIFHIKMARTKKISLHILYFIMELFSHVIENKNGGKMKKKFRSNNNSSFFYIFGSFCLFEMINSICIVLRPFFSILSWF